MPKHLLYEINLEHLIAFCTKCGYVEIVVPTTRTGKTKRPICSNRAKEIEERRQQERELAREARLISGTWKKRHILSDVNPEARSAVCSICGPTDIWIHRQKFSGKAYYSCGNYSREKMSKYMVAHYKGRPTNPHALSQIDEEAYTAVCATCGPVKIEIRRANKFIVRRCINAPKPQRAKKT
jgi:hypothetical protein